MSEYQYYEFLTIDRPLTSAQMAELRKVSSRATITPTSFINEYNFGDFRGDPEEFLTRYFDAMVYVTNWGTHQFMFRVPRSLVNRSAIEPYETEGMLNISSAGSNYIIDICREDDEGGDWEEGAGQMAAQAGIRGEVIGGDFRSLFLAWLGDLQVEGIDGDEPVPPIPPGLKKLTASQQALVDFIGLDEDLLKMVAAESADTSAAEGFDIDAALQRVSPADKNEWLKEVIETSDPHLGLRIKLKLQAMAGLPQASAARVSGETAGELLARYQRHEQELDQKRRELSQARRRKEEVAAAAAREKQLDELAKNVAGAWRNVDQSIALKTKEGYRQAVETMKDLRDLSKRPGHDPAAFKHELESRMAMHERKPNFIQMVRLAGLNL